MARPCTVCAHPSRAEVDIRCLEGIGTQAIAAEFGISLSSLNNHRTGGHPARELTRQVLNAHAGPLSDFAQIMIASKVVRVQKLQTAIDKLEAAIAARAVAYGHLPGGETGLIVLKRKLLGSGPMAYEIEEAVFDSAIISEYRAILEQAAKECGEWRPDGGEKAEATARLAQSIVIHAAVNASKAISEPTQVIDIKADT